jgi:hypothetical protein
MLAARIRIKVMRMKMPATDESRHCYTIVTGKDSRSG